MWISHASPGLKSVRRYRLAALAVLLVIVASPESVPQESLLSIAVDVRLVNLNVAVVDRNGQPYSGLSGNNFRVYDNGVEQAIHHFSTEDLPYSMGLVLDRSGSMTSMIREVYDAAFHTVQASKTEDEFFIELFNDQVEMRQDLTSDQGLLQRQLEGVVASGSTALYDAILIALDRIKAGRHEKKALLVITDGDDNSSKHSFQEVLQWARADGVAIYVVGMFDQMFLAKHFLRDDGLRAVLSQLATETGGRAYFPRNIRECQQACVAIAHELRQQYSLGYYPRPKLLDGSWRSIQVQLNLPEDLHAHRLTARTRSGYFAPQQ